MRFGLILNGGNRPEQERQQAFADMLAKARVAQQYGFHSLWVGPGYLQQGWHTTVLLGRIAAEVPEIALGTVEMLPLQHPVELAEQLATLDVICGGRLTLAAALGWRDFQFRAFDIPLNQRLGRFHEVIQVMQQLWTQERVTYHGKYFHLDDVPGAGRPVQQGGLNWLIAANLDPGIVRAARLAHGWLISSRATMPTIEKQIPLYRSALQSAGRQGYVSAWREMFVAASTQKALDTIQPHVEWLYRDRAAMGHNTALPTADRIDVPFAQVVAGRFVLGTPDECIAEIARYQALGVEEMILRCQWPGLPIEDSLQAIHLFGREVLPRC